MYCSAFRWEFLVLDLPGFSTLLSCPVSPEAVSSKRAGPSKAVSCTLRCLHSFSPIRLQTCHLWELCLDQFRRLITWCSLFASHHDPFRSSQASFGCFEDCSVDSPEVSLFLVLKLVGAQIMSFPPRPVASDRFSRSVHPIHLSLQPRVSGSSLQALE